MLISKTRILSAIDTFIPAASGYYLLVFLSFTLFTCTQTEDPAARPYPRLRTLSVEQTIEATIFTGEVFFNSSQITDYGFIWTTLHEPSTGLAGGYKISLGSKSGTGTFSSTITTTLQKNGFYTVKAYATTGQFTVFGTEMTFTSKYGSPPPQITSVKPIKAFLGDTITLFGKYFNYMQSANKVWLDNTEAFVVAASDTTVKVIVPATLSKSTSIKISLITGGKSATKENAFDIVTPAIHGFSPVKGGIGDRITILGKNFHPVATENQVFFANQPVPVKEVYPDRLIVELPVNDYNGLANIKVNVLSQANETTHTFEWVPSKISDIQPRNVAYGDTVIITGNNLKASDHSINIWMEGGAATPIEYTDSYIKAVIPAYFEKPETGLNLHFAYTQVQITSPVTLKILPYRITNFYPKSGKAGDLITIEGDNFSPIPYVYYVYVGTYPAQVWEASKNKLVIKVPESIKAGTGNISVTLAGVTTEAGEFTVIP